MRPCKTITLIANVRGQVQGFRSAEIKEEGGGGRASSGPSTSSNEEGGANRPGEQWPRRRHSRLSSEAHEHGRKQRERVRVIVLTGVTAQPHGPLAPTEPANRLRHAFAGGHRAADPRRGLLPRRSVDGQQPLQQPVLHDAAPVQRPAAADALAAAPSALPGLSVLGRLRPGRRAAEPLLSDQPTDLPPVVLPEALAPGPVAHLLPAITPGLLSAELAADRAAAAAVHGAGHRHRHRRRPKSVAGLSATGICSDEEW